ncbi:hypothetical protein [Actinoallomurus acaciae]|uniref:Integrase catalytic domain-containing protein n=1 Tax=Actinoallomurus acaciae TaxID=502577 RepID=A0ABV5YHB6_9ACTN
MPPPAASDPLTGQQIRARRYKGPAPGDLIHIHVNKLEKIPDGGGRRAHDHSETIRGRGIGYVRTTIDHHPHLAHAEIRPDEKDTSRTGFLTPAAAFFTTHGIHPVLTDNAKSHRISRASRRHAPTREPAQKPTRPHYPWTNGETGRLNRTLATEWAY